MYKFRIVRSSFTRNTETLFAPIPVATARSAGSPSRSRDSSSVENCDRGHAIRALPESTKRRNSRAARRLPRDPRQPASGNTYAPSRQPLRLLERVAKVRRRPKQKVPRKMDWSPLPVGRQVEWVAEPVLGFEACEPYRFTVARLARETRP